MKTENKKHEKHPKTHSNKQKKGEESNQKKDSQNKSHKKQTEIEYSELDIGESTGGSALADEQGSL